ADGIRDFHVTGVQTCALPTYPGRHGPPWARRRPSRPCRLPGRTGAGCPPSRSPAGGHPEGRSWPRGPRSAALRRPRTAPGQRWPAPGRRHGPERWRRRRSPAAWPARGKARWVSWCLLADGSVPATVAAGALAGCQSRSWDRSVRARAPGCGLIRATWLTALLPTGEGNDGPSTVAFVGLHRAVDQGDGAVAGLGQARVVGHHQHRAAELLVEAT